MRRFLMGSLWFSVFLFILNVLQVWALRLVSSITGEEMYATGKLAQLFITIALSLAVGGTVSGRLPGTRPKVSKNKKADR